MGKFFKTLISSVKSFKSPSKQKVVEGQCVSFTQEDRNVSRRKEDKDQTNAMKKGYKDRCLWSLSKSSSRNRDTIVNITSLDLVEDNAIQDKSDKLDEQEKKESNSPLKSIPSEFYSSKEVSKTELIVQETHWQLERVASTKIQTAFRCYLARREFRALKALVRLQALARGRIVRKRSMITLVSFNALIRVQALSRGCHVRKSELGQLVQRHLHQSKQQRKKPGVKSQHRQDAVMKRQRALLYALSAQLKRSISKKSYKSDGFQPEESHWVWMWLKCRTESHARGNYANLMKGPKSVERQETEKQWHVESSTHAVETAVDENQQAANMSLRPEPKSKEVVVVVQENVVSCGKDTTSSSNNASSTKEEQEESMPLVTEIKEFEMHVKKDEYFKPSTMMEGVDAKCESSHGDNLAIHTRSLSSLPLPSPVAASFESSMTKGEESPQFVEPVSNTVELSSQISLMSDVETNVIAFRNSTKVVSDSHYQSNLAEEQPPGNSTSDVHSSAVNLTNTSIEAIEVSISPTKQSPTPSSAFSLVGCFSPPQPVSPPALSLGEQGPLSITKLSSLSTSHAIYEDFTENAYPPREKNGSNDEIRGLSTGSHQIMAENDDILISKQVQDTLILKQDEEIVVEQISPSVPSYMATTMSSKAKARISKSEPLKFRAETFSPNMKQDSPLPKQDSLLPKQDSPKPKQDIPKPKQDTPKTKQDSPKPKQDSPKPKQDSPMPKQESPTPKQDSPMLKQDAPKPKSDTPNLKQDCPKPNAELLKLRTNSLKLRTESSKLNIKSDPAPKRRYSLSALECKTTITSTAMPCAQRPTMHVRPNSKAKLNLRAPLV